MTLLFEPFILSLECRTLDDATLLNAAAQEAGFRESGLTSVTKRMMVSVRSYALRMEVPIAMDGKLLVDLPYLRTLVSMANDKFKKNSARIDRFYDLFALRFPIPAAVSSPVSDGAVLERQDMTSTSTDSPSTFHLPDGTVVLASDQSTSSASAEQLSNGGGETASKEDQWVLLVEQSKAKACKDALKDLLWLDFRHKPSSENNKVAFPVTATAAETLISFLQKSDGEEPAQEANQDEPTDAPNPKTLISVNQRRKFARSQRVGRASSLAATTIGEIPQCLRLAMSASPRALINLAADPAGAQDDQLQLQKNNHKLSPAELLLAAVREMLTDPSLEEALSSQTRTFADDVLAEVSGQ